MEQIKIIFSVTLLLLTLITLYCGVRLYWVSQPRKENFQFKVVISFGMSLICLTAAIIILSLPI